MEARLVERVYDRSFEMLHHLQVGSILDVITVDQGYLAVDDEEFGVERSQQKTVKVLRPGEQQQSMVSIVVVRPDVFVQTHDHLDIDSGYFFW